MGVIEAAVGAATLWAGVILLRGTGSSRWLGLLLVLAGASAIIHAASALLPV